MLLLFAADRTGWAQTGLGARLEALGRHRKSQQNSSSQERNPSQCPPNLLREIMLFLKMN